MGCEKIRRFFHDEKEKERGEGREKKGSIVLLQFTFAIVLLNKNTYTEGAHADNPSHHITAEVFIFTAMPMGFRQRSKPRRLSQLAGTGRRTSDFRNFDQRPGKMVSTLLALLLLAINIAADPLGTLVR